MTPRVMREGLIAVIVVSGAAAGMAAVPTVAPMDLIAAEIIPGTINIQDNRVPLSGQASSGNPLWAIPLNELSATRDRPIFSPSRRPLAPAVAALPYTPPPQPAKPAEPDRLQLSLVGTISGDREGFGIFLDRAANTVLRLKTGDEHKGWVLREVRSRETVLEKGDKTTTLALPVQPRVSPHDSVEDDKNVNRSRR